MVLGSAIQTGDVVSRARAMDKLHRTEALQLLEEHLTVKPTDSDAITLHGTLLSWEGRYVEARSDLTKVLAAHPGHHDALRALINVEMWSDHPAEAERLAREALALEPGDPDLILVRVRALTAMKRLREAGDLAAAAVRVDPTNRRAADLGEDVADSLRQWKMSLGHSSQWFSDGRTPWNEDQMSLSRQTRTGSVIARFSNASRRCVGWCKFAAIVCARCCWVPNASRWYELFSRFESGGSRWCGGWCKFAPIVSAGCCWIPNASRRSSRCGGH